MNYTVTVKNKFQALEDESNNERYAKFVEANTQAMEECVPRKSKVRKMHRSSHPKIEEARQVAQEAQCKFTM